MKEPLPGGPQIRSRVLIENFSATKWTQSYVEGHGPVWWKKEVVQEKVAPIVKVLSLQELLEKDLHSFSLDGQKKTFGLASSHGVYRTLDGKNWTKIPEFAELDLPVCVHPDGPWFVGSYRSFDQGQSFEPFLRWDLITDLIQNEIKRPALYLKLTGINALKNSQVEITVDSGYRKIKLRGHVLGQFWSVVK